MPIDGLSFLNNELYKVAAPASEPAKEYAECEAKTAIKKPEQNEKTKSDVESNHEESKDLEGRDCGDDCEEEPHDEIEIFQTESGKKKYKVKFNNETDMVELIDKETGKTVQTLSPEDLKSLIERNKKSSGMLVDREG